MSIPSLASKQQSSPIHRSSASMEREACPSWRATAAGSLCLTWTRLRPQPRYLHVDASFVVLGALGTPFLLTTSPLLASLQGEQRWVPWSVLSLGIALSRIAFVAIFVYPFGIAGVMLGTSVGAAVIYVIALAMVWPQIREGRR